MRRLQTVTFLLKQLVFIFNLSLVWVLLIHPAYGKEWLVSPSEQLEFDAQEALLSAQPGDTVVLPEGRFEMSIELSMVTPHITLKGQGIDKTILVYTESAVGPQAIISMADHTTVEDLTVINHPGDGIKMVDVDGATIRRVKVEWTDRGNINNGAYGLYPVLSKNVLMENNIVIGASDAGIYVGQSKQIIVRRNRIEYNVAGIEIENSQKADVYENIATNNTSGILVFNLPNLLVQGGKGTRIYHNSIYENNFRNFAPKGNSVALVPQGTGILIMGNDDIEIFQNSIDRHNTTSIAIVSYHITERAVEDKNYDALPESIFIYDNDLSYAGRWPFKGANPLGMVVGALSFPNRVPHITYDGIGQPDGGGGFFKAKLNGSKSICITDNRHDGGKNSYFGNMNLWTQRRFMPIPGDLDSDISSHDCQLEKLPAVILDDVPEIPTLTPITDPNLVDQICEKQVEGVNWEAYSVDCPKLSHYNFFSNPSDALSGLNSGGFVYEMNTPLFSDYASKRRAIFIPPGKKAIYRESDILELPLGSLVAKTFHFPHDLRSHDSDTDVIETRIIVKRATGWVGLEYVWDHSSGDAYLKKGGAVADVAWIDEAGMLQSTQYPIPNLAQCVSCHLNNRPIGIRPGYLNREGVELLAGQNQLTYMVEKGLLVGVPENMKSIPKYAVWNDESTGSLEKRARTYLDINCAHCHSIAGKGNTSGMFLNLSQPLNINYGICKPPIAAGRGAGGTLFDIVPGEPSKSILISRMNSTKAAIKMPEVAKSMVHAEGVSLVSDWIASMGGQCAK